MEDEFDSGLDLNPESVDVGADDGSFDVGSIMDDTPEIAEWEDPMDFEFDEGGALDVGAVMDEAALDLASEMDAVQAPEFTDDFPQEPIEDTPVEAEPVEDIPVEEPVEDTPVEEPVEDIPVEAEPVEDIPVEAEPVEDIPVEAEPVEDIPVEAEPVEDIPVEAEPVEDIPVEAEPVEDTPVEEPVEDIPVEAEPVEDTPVEEPVEDIPVEAEPVEDIPVEAEPVEDIPVEAEPVEDVPVEAEPVEDIPVEAEPVEDIPVEAEPVEDIPVEAEPVEDTPVEELVEDIPVEAEPVEDIPVEAEPVEDIPVEAEPVEDIPVEAEPVEDIPVEAEPVEDIPVEVEPVEDVPVEAVEQPPEIPEREYDDFEESVRLDQEDFYESGTFYTQGINEYGYSGTCGETSMASTINRVLGTNEYTENKVLDVAVQEGLCDTGSFDDSGGTTTDQFMELYDKMNESCGGQLEVERFDFDNVLSMEEAAQRLEEGCTLNVAVDSNTLWDQADPMGSPFPETKATDHWITVTGVQRNEDGSIRGFDIIDSGGGEGYVDADKYQAMCYGTEDLVLTDPTCIVVSKKDADTAVPTVDSETAAPEFQEDYDMDGDSGFDGSLSPEDQAAYQETMEEKPLKIDEGRVFTRDELYEQFSACPEDSDQAFSLQRLIHQPGNRR